MGVDYMARFFPESAKLTKIHDMINIKIKVEDKYYNFDEMIENEIVADFPFYSYRMRKTFVDGAKIIDDFLQKTSLNLFCMEQAIHNNMDIFISDRQNHFDEWFKIKESSIDDWFKVKQSDYNSWYSEKDKVYLIRMNELNKRIKDFDSLKTNLIATEDKPGIITEKRVKEISPRPKIATLDEAGIITEKRVKEISPRPKIATIEDVDYDLDLRAELNGWKKFF